MEYYIYNVPVFVTDPTQEGVDVGVFCQEVEEILPPQLLAGVDVVYIGKFEELADRNATFANGGIYMTSAEPANFDMVENFIHEVAHSLEATYGMEIYTNDLHQEFLGKRHKLYYLLNNEGYHLNQEAYANTEYNKEFDSFLANVVGYPLLLNLTMGLFISPYGATSMGEYFANGFEKYFLGDATALRKISPVLYRKIEKIINDET
jgi:hypothetical protein